MGYNGDKKLDARKGRNSPIKSGGRGSSDLEFVNRELTTEELPVYRNWREDHDAVYGEVDRMLEDGYKFSLKYDEYTSAYAAFVFASDGSDNAGKCLTGRGGTSYRALSEVVFKHVELFGGNWLDTGRTVNPTDDPDW